MEVSLTSHVNRTTSLLAEVDWDLSLNDSNDSGALSVRSVRCVRCWAAPTWELRLYVAADLGGWGDDVTVLKKIFVLDVNLSVWSLYSHTEGGQPGIIGTQWACWHPPDFISSLEKIETLTNLDITRADFFWILNHFAKSIWNDWI